MDYQGVPTWNPGEGFLLGAGREQVVHHRYCPVGVAGADWVVIPDPSAADVLETGRASRCPECRPNPETPPPRGE